MNLLNFRILKPAKQFAKPNGKNREANIASGSLNGFFRRLTKYNIQ